MNRRDFMRAVGTIAGLSTMAIPTRAQSQVRRIGVLTTEGPGSKLLEETLKKRGWLLGQDLSSSSRCIRHPPPMVR